MGIHGVGIDVVDVARVARLLHGPDDRFARRWFAPEEIAQCRASPEPSRAFAERLAAKESVWKALRLDGRAGTVPWRQITVLRSSAAGEATVELAAEVRSAAAGVGTIHLDWVVSAGVALAVAVAQT